jgi:hypothetical protein
LLGRAIWRSASANAASRIRARARRHSGHVHRRQLLAAGLQVAAAAGDAESLIAAVAPHATDVAIGYGMLPDAAIH